MDARVSRSMPLTDHGSASDQRPLLSVITVARNAGPLVLEAIRSVQEQDYPAIEHVVIDGGSTDGSAELIREHLRAEDTFVSEPDDGIYDAMNKGIRRARGEVIALLNADDRYAHARVASTFMQALDDPEIDCVLGDVAFFREHPDRIVRRYDSGHFRPARIRWGIMPAHPGMVLRRSVYERVGLYRTDYRIAADFEFVARAFGKGGTHYTHIPEIFVKMALGGVSTQGARARQIINRECLRACRDNSIYSNLPMIASKYMFKLLEFFR
jgi:glycosyltransferase involved in cell wall biosynthesis